MIMLKMTALTLTSCSLALWYWMLPFVVIFDGTSKQATYNHIHDDKGKEQQMSNHCGSIVNDCGFGRF